MFGEGLTLIDPGGRTIAVTLPDDWPGPTGRVVLSDPIGEPDDATPWRREVKAVSWHDAQEFCERLSALPEAKRLGRVYRLPTQPEWEHACRAGSSTPFHFGSSLSFRQANFNAQRPYGKAVPKPLLGVVKMLA